MSKNIVVLSGSPRKNGNTERLAASFVEGAESAGKNVTLFRVADMNIAGCLGCNCCYDGTGICVQKDDAQTILDALKNADAFVLASAIYFSIISRFSVLTIQLATRRFHNVVLCGDSSPTFASLRSGRLLPR